MDTQGLAFVDGWRFPAHAANPRKYLNHADQLAAAMPYCAQRRRAIQAGGHCGAYPIWLAKHFRAVYTWEPEALNFACLMENVATHGNISRIFAARGLLGRDSGTLELSVHGRNIGGHKVIEDAPGNYPVTRIDDLGFYDLDFIALDVENMELPVLEGARNTLCRCRPVLMIEAKDFGQKGIWGDRPSLMDYLANLGYVVELWTRRDVVLTCRKASA